MSTKNQAPSTTIEKRLTSIKRDLKVGALIVSLILGGHYLLEHADVGHRLELLSYEKLQGFIQAPLNTLPVVIVDFGRNFDVGPNSATDMGRLAQLLDNVAKQHPATIGIDVDFGVLPGDAGLYPDPENKVIGKALEVCKRGIPVYLTVGRGLWRGEPDTWLGTYDERFGIKGPDTSKLITHPLTPIEGPEGQLTLFEDLWVPLVNRPGTWVPSLAGKLADVFREKHGLPEQAKPSVLVEPYAVEVDKDAGLDGQTARFRVKQYYVNYSVLDELKNERTIPIRHPDDVNAWSSKPANIQGSICILGSVDPARDSARFPGSSRPGGAIYLHALGAYTKLFAPVYALAGWLRVMIIIALSLAVLLLPLWIRWRLVADTSEIAAERLSTLTAFGLVVLTIGLGVGFARAFGVLWMDWYLVILMLLLHPGIEHNLVGLGKWAKMLVYK